MGLQRWRFPDFLSKQRKKKQQQKDGFFSYNTNSKCLTPIQNNNAKIPIPPCTHPSSRPLGNTHANIQTDLGRGLTGALWFSQSLQRACSLLPLSFLLFLLLLCAIGKSTGTSRATTNIQNSFTYKGSCARNNSETVRQFMCYVNC